ncbi:MAG: TRAP transporter small permease [Granulosicoccus sp.]|nr:TRAP transporter small permease [Granulosicoccus sp.]
MYHLLTRVASAMAILGALVLSFLIIMTCVSVLGRELNSVLNSSFMQAYVPGLANTLLDLGIGPVLGDFELLENMMPFAIFAFLPLAQIGSAHATVDVFTSTFPRSVLAWMRAVTEVVFAAVLIVFAFKLFQGMQAKMRYGETTYLIQFPVWWAYAAAFCASVVAALVGCSMALLCLLAATRGRSIEPGPGETQE